VIPRDSIRARLFGLSALLIGAALLIGWLAIGTILERFVTDRYDAEAEAVAEALMAAAAIDAQGRMILPSPPADPRFQLPLSGWYWQLEQDGRAVAKSPSLYDNVMKAPAADFSGGPGLGPEDQPLRVLRHGFTLPDSRSAMAVIVAAPMAEIGASLARVRRPLAVSLAVLGLGLGLASVVQVMAGLNSLDRLGRDLRAIRDGRAEALPLPPVAELRPVAIEINALLAENRQVLARAREHLGNLAHSLRTPLAALTNALPPDHPGQALIARMERQIGWHLRRARSAGGARVLGRRSPVAPVVADILMVLGVQVRDRALRVETAIPPDLALAGERQDLEEMVGNLVDNACKWAASRIAVSARAEGPGMLCLTIADDGPGMAEHDHARAIARGGRLDEGGPPGSGLGLAIVADLAALNGGGLALGRSPLGGLAAELRLPA
jgi:signal transduction histidine kinase